MKGKLNRADKETEEHLDTCPRWLYCWGCGGEDNATLLAFISWFQWCPGDLAARGVGRFWGAGGVEG